MRGEETGFEINLDAKHVSQKEMGKTNENRIGTKKAIQPVQWRLVSVMSMKSLILYDIVRPPFFRQYSTISRANRYQRHNSHKFFFFFSQKIKKQLKIWIQNSIWWTMSEETMRTGIRESSENFQLDFTKRCKEVTYNGNMGNAKQ